MPLILLQFMRHITAYKQMIGAALWSGCLLLGLPVRAQDSLQIDAIDSDLEYGVIANETGICRMNDRGSLLGLSGQNCLGSGSPATFTINGDPGLVIFITAVGSTNGLGVEFDPTISGSATRVISFNGSTTLTIVGDLILNNAQGGSHSLQYLVNINYE